MSLRKPAACRTMSFAVRRARSDEIAACAALYERVGKATFTWRPADFFKAADFLRFAKQEEVFVAESNGQILGLLSLYRPEHFVHCLYVDLPAQGLGVGRALIEHAAVETRGPLALKVDEPNKRALAFYERQGFSRAETGDDRGTKWVLMKRLR